MVSPAISVPTVLNSNGLSKLVYEFLNEVLLSEQEEEEAREKMQSSSLLFETLCFLDTKREKILPLPMSLEKYMKKNALSEEDSLVLEFTFLISQPKYKQSAEVPDWISCLSSFSNHVFAGSFDGSLLYSNANTEKTKRFEGVHFAPIKGIKCIQQREKINKNMIVCCASKDSSISVLKFAEEGGFVAVNPETGTTTQGESAEDALANLREATALYLEEFPLVA